LVVALSDEPASPIQKTVVMMLVFHG